MLNKSFDYTTNMKSIFKSNFLELKSFYCREDIELALKDYDNAPSDAKEFRKRDILELVKGICEARNIDLEMIIKDRSMLEQIPTRNQVKEDLLQSFYNMYSQAPATSNFMERIVRRLAPEYISDSVRVAILKKFIVGGGDNFKRFNTGQLLEWARKQLSRSEKCAFDDLSEGKKKELLISKIDDSIFEYKSEKLTASETLKLILDCAQKFMKDVSFQFDQVEISKDNRAFLYSMISCYEADAGKTVLEDLQILNKCVQDGKISDKDEPFVELVFNIEKDLRKQLKKIKRISKSGGIGTVDEKYKDAKRYAIKTKKNVCAEKNAVDFDLLKLCNDLASGNFRVNGKTKKALYYFALMFGMTVSIDGENVDLQKDVVKNLFHDFYNDNLLRIFAGENNESKKSTALETEPTGEGINYKNFVEMIYFYFLYRVDFKMTPGEKIDAAEAIIADCLKRPKSNDKRKLLKSGAHTKEYREMYASILVNKKIDEVADYISRRYQIFNPDNTRITQIMVAAEENTAHDLIEEIINDIDGAYPDIELFDVRQKLYLTKDIKDDIISTQDVFFNWEIKTLLEERFSNDEKFLKVVSALDDRTHIRKGRFSRNERSRMLMILHILTLYSSKNDTLSMLKLQNLLERKGIISIGNQLNNSISILIKMGFAIKGDKDGYYLANCEYDDILNRILKIVSKHFYRIDDESHLMMTEALICKLKYDKRVTRSELIAIHLNYYIALLNDTKGLYSFEEVLEDYAHSINWYLVEARYQPLSEKNIFDMYVVTALYFHLVDSNGYM